MERFILISGCSGGGKSTLLAELQRRGHHVIEEPGRRIVAQELSKNGSALPWKDITSFANQAIELARADRSFAATKVGSVFFDRGLIDAASALEVATGSPALHLISGERYNRIVFFTPPWPEIYQNDSERQHSFDTSVLEYDRLLMAFAKLNYDIVKLPFATVFERADFILSRVSQTNEKR